MKELKNREAIIDELIEMLKTFDKIMNRYQTDIYLYLSEDGTATLDLFTNVGGNSWLDDDHYCIYSDKEHYEDLGDWYSDYCTADIAEIVGLTESELIAKTAEFKEIEPEEVDSCEIWYFLKSNDEYMEKLQAEYESAIDTDFNGVYSEKAEYIISRFEDEEE